MSETYKIINGICPPMMEILLYYEKIRITQEIFEKYLMKIGKQWNTEQKQYQTEMNKKWQLVSMILN